MNWLAKLTLITVVLQVWNLYRVNVNGEVSHWLMVAVYTGYLVVEMAIAVEGGWMAFVGLFCLLDLWAIGTAVRGLQKASGGKDGT